jgi:dTDP-4-amino-4,6-dideoxygalactose transaminase
MSNPPWVVPLSDVVGDDELVDAAVAAVRSGWWSTGPRVAALESEFAAFSGARHAIAVANGTAALHLSFLAAGVGQGDEVIVPSLTFVAAANAIRHAGATPVFCDIRGASDLNLDPADVEAAISERTKAICVLHYGGFACDISAIQDIARRHDVILIEDAAHAVAGYAHGAMCGTFGLFGCFSFFSNKNLPIGEGGMVITSDDEMAARIRLLRSHGMTTLTWDRHRGHASDYDVVEVGFNYRLDEIRAAMALVQLGRLPDATRRRSLLAEKYREALHGTDGIVMPFAARDDRADSAHHLAVALLPDGVDRSDVRAALASERIQTSVHYPPIHTFTAYRELPHRSLPQTEAVASRLLTLPLYPGLTSDQVDLVAASVVRALRGAAGFTFRSEVESSDEDDMSSATPASHASGQLTKSENRT